MMLAQDHFLVGLANLERFYRRSLKPFDRDIYYEAVKSAATAKWEKCVRYACQHSKTFPRPVELRSWMGLAEGLTPAEEERGDFKAGTIRGVNPADLALMARHGQALPFDDDCWADASERLFYLDQPFQDPPPFELNLDGRLAWIRKYAEKAQAQYEASKVQGDGKA